ncbi:MAG: D-alanyl-D-alanine carboxypeptidase [Gammaproteobacteria bacterium]|nr:D-alanyl-D-alanine carboxypeptidase [Gammaproteobacteria bacterium]
MTLLHKILFASLLLLVSLSVSAAPAIIPAPPSVPATSYLLIDFHSGKTLAEKDADMRVEPASITKLMSGYVLYRALASGSIALDDEVLVSEKAWRTYGSRMFIEVNHRVKLSDLLRGMVVQSGNDATVALAEHLAGSESGFVAMMNAEAQRLGMTATHFANATGMPHEDHYTTAHDIATLMRAVITEFPEHYALYKEREFTYNGIKQYNRNKLLWRDPSVDGGKTGHTESAGYCLVASAERDGMRLISVVLGTDSEDARARHSQALLNYGYRFFETHRLYGAGEALTEARVWKGAEELVGLGLDDDLYVTIPRGQYGKLDAVMELTPNVEAPVARGTALGDVNVSLDGEVIHTQPLVALKDVDQGGFFRRTTDAVIRWFD